MVRMHMDADAWIMSVVLWIVYRISWCIEFSGSDLRTRSMEDIVTYQYIGTRLSAEKTPASPQEAVHRPFSALVRPKKKFAGHPKGGALGPPYASMCAPPSFVPANAPAASCGRSDTFMQAYSLSLVLITSSTLAWPKGSE